MVPKPKNRRWIVVVLALAVVLSGCAAVPFASNEYTAREIGERAQEKYESIESYEGTITTSFHSTERNRTTTAHVWVKPHAQKTRYEYVSPETMAGSVIVSNGSTMTMYNASENTVTQMSLSVGGSELPAQNFSRQFEHVLDNFNVERKGTAAIGGRSTYALELTPKENGTGSGMVERYRLWIDKDRWFPLKTEMTMNMSGKVTKMTTTYTDLTFNSDIPESTFEFEPPVGATVQTNEAPSIERFESVDEAKAASPIEMREPSSVPDGYAFEQAVVSTSSEHNSVSLTYVNDGKKLLVTQSTRSPTDLDGDDSVMVNGHEATVRTFGDVTSLTWTCEGVTISVNGELSTDALVDVASSIDCG